MKQPKTANNQTKMLEFNSSSLSKREFDEEGDLTVRKSTQEKQVNVNMSCFELEELSMGNN